ncbi:hypothetical protein [Streptomyces iranensis]|uniref:hypothetical protein n=1 Tax=Streptomyces iranensis TaxID=576784 RepID=UPI0039B78AA4
MAVGTAGRLGHGILAVLHQRWRSHLADVFDRRCAYALADALGTDVVELPGGHNGNTSHPSACAAILRDLLATHVHAAQP